MEYILHIPTEPVPGSEIVGPAELRSRKHENKTGGNRPANFSCAFCFRVFPTIW